MKIISQFNPLLTANLTGTTPALSGTINAQLRPGQGKIVVYNQSIANINFAFSSSTHIDFVGAQSYRIFYLDLPSWIITWSLVNFATQNSAVQTYPTPANQHFSPGGLITIVAYESDEEIPQIGTLSSYLNPWDYDKLISTVQASSSFTVGANGTVFTLDPASLVTSGQMVYLAGVYITINQTSASTNNVRLAFTTSGGLHLTDLLVNNNLTNPTFIPFTFSPALMDTSIGNLGANIKVVCTASSIAGSGADRTCTCLASWYAV